MPRRVRHRAIPISVTLPPEVLEMVDTEVEALGMSRSAFVSIALDSFVRQLRERKENPMQTSIDFLADYGSNKRR